MFPTKEGIAAAKLAFRATRSFLMENPKSLSLEQAISTSLQKVFSEYIYHNTHHRTTLAQGNEELKAISELAATLYKCLSAASNQAIFSIEKEVQFKIGNKDARGFVADVLPKLKQINEACGASLKIKGKKSKRLALNNCCTGLWHIREEMSGCAFTRTFDTAAGRDGEQFTHQDALFVQVAIKAVDPDVQLKTIKSELKSISRAVSSRKKLKKLKPISDC